MRTKKLAQKKNSKFRLLFDTAFARPSAFTKLQKRAYLRHIRHDFSFSPQAEDKEIYQLAAKEKLFIVTMNYKDFRKFVRPGKPGVLSLVSGLTNEQIDEALTQFITGKNPDDYWGKATKVK